MKKIVPFLMLASGIAQADVLYTVTGKLVAAAPKVACSAEAEEVVAFDFTGIEYGASNPIAFSTTPVKVTCPDGNTQDYKFATKGADGGLYSSTVGYMTSFKAAAPAGPEDLSFDYNQTDLLGASLPGFEGFAQINFYVDGAIANSKTFDSDATVTLSAGLFGFDGTPGARYNRQSAHTGKAPTYGPFVSIDPTNDATLYFVPVNDGTPGSECSTAPSPDSLTPDNLQNCFNSAPTPELPAAPF